MGNSSDEEFSLWRWMLSREYITTIKDVVINSRSPMEGYLTFGDCWYPINGEEPLQGWLAQHFTNKLCFDDVISLSQVKHPIASVAQNIIKKSRSYYNEMINIYIESFELGDVNGLNKCLADTNHKYHETLKEAIEGEKNQCLTPKYFNIEEKDIKRIIRYAVEDVLFISYDPEFKPIDLPKIRISGDKNTCYAIFPNEIRRITFADNIISSQKGTITSNDKIRNLQVEKDKFQFVINNWIPDINQRETFRQYAKNIIQGLPWKDIFLIKDEVYDSYQPYEILKWLFMIMNPLNDINYITVEEDQVPHENGSMYIYSEIMIPEKYLTTGYNIRCCDQQDVTPNDKFLVKYFGDDINKQEDFFQRQNEHMLSLILWALGDNFPCRWNTLILPRIPRNIK